MAKKKNSIENSWNKENVLSDYRLAVLSRNLSVLGRREVLTGKAKFGIFGDGKEVVQIALARQFRNGDWRSGYYRDQTWMMAMGLYDSLEFFHQLYGNTDADVSHGSQGRVFNNHFSVPNINPDGTWRDLTKQKNSSSDISPTAGQMPRLLGLAYASKLFRQNKELHKYSSLSVKGDEVAFGSIGDASTSEGHFWETMNAAGVLQVPMAISVYDDGYGISVPKTDQTANRKVSDNFTGFLNLHIIQCNGKDVFDSVNAMIDAKKQQLVWQGRGTKTLDPSASQQKREENINYAVKEIFKKYPPVL